MESTDLKQHDSKRDESQQNYKVVCGFRTRTANKQQIKKIQFVEEMTQIIKPKITTSSLISQLVICIRKNVGYRAILRHQQQFIIVPKKT
jgi:hypothetical protein